jgi:hypothetical protein
MTTPAFTPPPGTSVDAGPSIFTNPPQMPGITTTPPAVTAPAVPATTVAVTNTNGVDVIVYIAAASAAVTVIKVNGVTTGLQLLATATSAVSVYLAAGATISMTYASTAPTWVWLAV